MDGAPWAIQRTVRFDLRVALPSTSKKSSFESNWEQEQQATNPPGRARINAVWNNEA
jgi:hypothetical protein